MKKILSVLLIVILSALSVVMLAACQTGGEAVVTFQKENLAKDATLTTESNVFTLDFHKDVTFNTLYLQEKTDNVVLARFYKWTGSAWDFIYETDRLGEQNLFYVEEHTASQIRLEVFESLGKVRLKTFEVYHQQKADKPFKVSEYLILNNLNMDEKKTDPAFLGYFDVVTDIIIFQGITIGDDGNLVLTSGLPEKIAILSELAAATNTRVWATVFFNHGGLEETASFLQAKRTTINQSLKDFVAAYNLYGIDYDWEYPESKSQWAAYNQLIQDTAKTCKVSVAIAPWRFDATPETVAAIEHFNVMAYDLFDERGYHSTMMSGGFTALSDCINRLKLPREKLLLGIPTYGRATNRSASSWPTYGEFVQADENGDLSSLLGKYENRILGYEYLENGILKTSAAYLNGFAITRDKTELAILAKLGGVMLFRAMCDAPYTYQYSLHKAVGEVVTALA